MDNMRASRRITVRDPPGVWIGSGIGHRRSLGHIFSVSYAIAKLDLGLVCDRTRIILDGEDP
jgi:hypothetical protein